MKKLLQLEYRSDNLLYILLFVVCRYDYNAIACHRFLFFAKVVYLPESNKNIRRFQ